MTLNFNPHSPCGERRNPHRTGGRQRNFNPHSPCGERLRNQQAHRPKPDISIHTPLAGSDFTALSARLKASEFQSTLPLRGATGSASALQGNCLHFNPHSPCGERRSPYPTARYTVYFNPHSPCGERPSTRTERRRCWPFQSTLPLRGATRRHSYADERWSKFQSTLPLRGATAEMRHF